MSSHGLVRTGWPQNAPPPSPMSHTPTEPAESSQLSQHAQPRRDNEATAGRQHPRARAHDQRDQPAEARIDGTGYTLRSETCRQVYAREKHPTSLPLPPPALPRAPIAVDYQRQGCTWMRATLRRLIGAKIYRVFFLRVRSRSQI